MTTESSYPALADELRDLLGLSNPPLAITFCETPPEDVAPYGGALSEAAPDGRRGSVPAGCVFWMKAAGRTFSTSAPDHGNCSVGSVTHGFLSLEEVSTRDDVNALMDAGWVRAADVQSLPVVRERPGHIVYGPLRETPVRPDVVFLRVNAKQAMMLQAAWPSIRLEGKPQCHIVAIAKEQGEVALSVGCMLSRVRTEMANGEMTCALPASKLAEVVAALRPSAQADKAVAAYAADDARRF